MSDCRRSDSSCYRQSAIDPQGRIKGKGSVQKNPGGGGSGGRGVGKQVSPRPWCSRRSASRSRTGNKTDGADLQTLRRTGNRAQGQAFAHIDLARAHRVGSDDRGGGAVADGENIQSALLRGKVAEITSGAGKIFVLRGDNVDRIWSWNIRCVRYSRN